jgi:hypothetical protein
MESKVERKRAGDRGWNTQNAGNSRTPPTIVRRHAGGLQGNSAPPTHATQCLLPEETA